MEIHWIAWQFFFIRIRFFFIVLLLWWHQFCCCCCCNAYVLLLLTILIKQIATFLRFECGFGFVFFSFFFYVTVLMCEWFIFFCLLVLSLFLFFCLWLMASVPIYTRAIRHQIWKIFSSSLLFFSLFFFDKQTSRTKWNISEFERNKKKRHTSKWHERDNPLAILEWWYLNHRHKTISTHRSHCCPPKIVSIHITQTTHTPKWERDKHIECE